MGRNTRVHCFILSALLKFDLFTWQTHFKISNFIQLQNFNYKTSTSTNLNKTKPFFFMKTNILIITVTIVYEKQKLASKRDIV